ncbi:hemolysin family protein [Helcobacillus massiliensis]|uniref:CBS domain containing-hemolysin-like protein n=1 Tax=Helcobacillus massiliensis TaxID=521392 RepID=A0A839QQ21_9MICO|nr:hemolysin family protein [Helcobacillus massiliensis]MBB3022092.1 CBS domain containing-hemolysin-like protein [Helcobacillus massiliensis]
MMTWLLLLAGVLLTLGTALFVAAEFSLVALDKHTVEKAAADGDSGAKGVLSALTHLSTNLSGAQVGITITTLLFGFAVQQPLTDLITPGLDAVGVPEGLRVTIGVALAMMISYAFSMVVGELIPKNLAIAVPYQTARVVAPLQHAFTVALRPVIIMFNATANFFLRLMNIEPQEELSSGRSPAELDSLVRHSARAGTLDRATAVLLSRTLQLREREAADVMTHRGKMLSIDVSATAEDVLALTRETGHSRFPVIEDSEDDVVGIIQVRQAVTVPREQRRTTTVRELMSEALRIPDTVPLDSLMVDLREAGAQLAVVIDEYGGTAGIVTLEDVIEEIVGEVSDEHDDDEPERFVENIDHWQVSGLMRPDEIRREMGILIEESTEVDTVGGIVMMHLGRIPAVGDTVTVGGVRYDVLAMDGRRIDSLRLTVLDPGVLAHRDRDAEEEAE